MTPAAGRRPRWSALAFVLLLVVPLVEIAVIIAVGRVIGGWPTLALLLVESALGAYLVRREGGAAWQALRQALATGRMPAGELSDAALVLVGGTLLLTPGFVTDVAGFACVLPGTRSVARKALTRVVARRLLVNAPGVQVWGSGVGFPGATGGFAGPRSTGPTTGPGGATRTSGDDDVIEGEIL